MREILFRGMTEDGEWLYGNYLAAKPDVESFDLVACIQDLLTFIPQEVKRETIGQYTGLKDIDGKMIFEGDILEVSNSDDPEYEILEWGTQGYIPDNIPLCDCKITGSIHDTDNSEGI